MATIAAPATPASPAYARAQVSDLSWTLGAVLFASTCIVTGLIWDISWHRTVGRDTFWTLPHLEEQLGASVAGLSCGWLVLKTTFAGSDADTRATVRFWGFRGPLGAWVCIWGTLLMISSAPFDNWWHNAYGLDVTIISPPHIVLLLGMVAIQIGAMLMALAVQNRAGDADARRYALVYAASGGILVTMMCTVIMEYTAANDMHGSLFYRITGAVIPVVLVAFARAGRLKWPATVTAAIYMGVSLLMMWILEAVPATPKLAPIYNPVTHMVPPFFPLLLVIPGVAIDLIMRRIGRGHDWLLSLALGLTFVAVMLGVQWFFAEFILSPAARNAVFAGDLWDYTSRLGPWRYQYWDAEPRATFVRGLGLAAVFAVVSVRVGLWWGSGMTQLKR